MNRARHLFVLLLMVLLTGAAQAEVKTGQQVDFSLTLMDRSKVSVDRLQDKLAVVEFWATWCPPCVQMVPHLREINEAYAPRGVQLISVSLDRDAVDAKRFIQEHQMTWAQAHEGSQRRPLSQAWGVTGIPRAFIIAPGGELLWQGHPAEIEAQIDKALEAHGDKLVAASLRLKPALKEMRRARAELARGAEAMPRVMPKVVKLLTMVPVEHYENKALARSAVKLHAALKQADPDGTLLAAALQAHRPNAAQQARIDAFMQAGAGAERAAEAGPGREAA